MVGETAPSGPHGAHRGHRSTISWDAGFSLLATLIAGLSSPHSAVGHRWEDCAIRSGR
jgi:hypothetical protein